jgi:hypothetical protein
MPHWPRVRKLDAPDMISRVAAAGGPRLALVRRLSGGEVGAAVVNLPSGDEVVLSMWPVPLERAREIVAVVSAVRQRGYPAPEFLQMIDCRGAVAVLQQLIAGAMPTAIDATLLADLFRVHGLQRNVFATAAGSPADLYLDRDGPGFCLHGPLADFSAETAALLARITGIGRRTPPTAGRGHDAVHGDFQLTNVLVDRSDPHRVAAVVDWTGARVGDAGLDLVTLGFFLDRAAAPAECRTRVRRRGARQVQPDAALAFAAHLALRQVDWVIRHHDAREVAAWLAVATDWLDWAGASTLDAG